jgi:hypothetical protein
MAASQSRLPKAQRVARVLDQEPVPDPEDYFVSAKYIDRRAEVGDFKGAPRGTVGILQYLWRHTVLTDDLRGECKGWVLTGKSKLAKIATENAVSYDHAKNVLDWLADNGWVWKLLDTKAGNRLSVKVLMDQEAHDARTLCDGTTVGMGQPPRGSGISSQTLWDEIPDNTSTSTSISTTTSTSEEEKVATREKKKSRANMPQFSQVRDQISSGINKDRAYTFWESKGSSVALPVGEVKTPGKDARTVTLTDDENAFYLSAFRFDGRDNSRRIKFLKASSEERAEMIETARAEMAAAAQPDPDLLMHRVPDGVKIWTGPVKGATEKVATTKLCKSYRLRIEAGDKIGYVTPEHYEILVETFGQAA